MNLIKIYCRHSTLCMVNQLVMDTIFKKTHVKCNMIPKESKIGKFVNSVILFRWMIQVLHTLSATCLWNCKKKQVSKHFLHTTGSKTHSLLDVREETLVFLVLLPGWLQ